MIRIVSGIACFIVAFEEGLRAMGWVFQPMFEPSPGLQIASAAIFLATGLLVLLQGEAR